MKQKTLSTGLWLLAAFLLFTSLVCLCDVRAIGPNGLSVGFATVNGKFRSLVGTHLFWYIITDWLGLVPIAVAAAFGGLGLWQWATRKRLRLVDRTILALGVLYFVLGAAYLLFEVFPLNYRPVLIDGRLEASYPSSSTLLTCTVLPAAACDLRSRIKSKRLRRTCLGAIVLFSAFMVIGRLIAGVHWLSDIVGGLLLSAALVTPYSAYCKAVQSRSATRG